MDNDKINDLADEVFKLSRNILSVKMRFLNMALSVLKPSLSEGMPSTDGVNLFVDPVLMLREYRRERNTAARCYLHMVFHCVFRHFFVKGSIDRSYWDLACDIAVENIINELDISALNVKRSAEQIRETNKLKKYVNMLTAEKLYRYFKDNGLSAEDYLRLRVLFLFDDHSGWYENESFDPCKKDHDQDDGGEGDRSDSERSDDAGGKQGDEDTDDRDDAKIEQNEKLRRKWEDISEKMQTELEAFCRMRGDTTGSLVQNLSEVNREKYDYGAFLKKFAVKREVMKINDDDFDYIFYTYGLDMYGNMPLIEPLEYKEVKKIQEFVIAIDTSDSVSGELVQKFVQKTYNILKSRESFFKKINLHIIQCDTEIKSDVKITSQEDFDRYLENTVLQGFGGTDFRPVFSYVDELIAKGEFVNLKGLIYFTDGSGIFPETQPAYSTAFVFVDDDYNNLNVPVWAIKLILKKDEI